MNALFFVLLLSGCTLFSREEEKKETPEERYHLTAKRIEEATEYCKTNGGIKSIVVGHKAKTICKNNAVFISKKDDKNAR